MLCCLVGTGKGEVSTMCQVLSHPKLLWAMADRKFTNVEETIMNVCFSILCVLSVVTHLNFTLWVVAGSYLKLPI